MTLPKSILLAVSDYSGVMYPDGSKTGTWFTEVYHPWKVFTAAGFKISLISENGQFGWDPHSTDPATGFITEEEKKVLDDPNSDFNKFIGTLQKADSVKPADFGIFFAAGGHGVLFDFEGHAPDVAKDAGEIWDDGGIVSAVCHGPVILGWIKDKKGNLIVDNKKVTGFSNKGEDEIGATAVIKEHGFKTVQEVVAPYTDKYVAPNPPDAPTVVQDGKLVTGANPASAGPLAEELVKLYNELAK